MSETLVNIEGNEELLKSYTEDMAKPIRIVAQLESNEAIKRKDTLFNAIKSDLEFKGFRKGKVPRKVAETAIGKEQLYRSLLSDLVREAAEQNNIDLVVIDRIIVNNIEDGSPLSLSAVIFAMPEVELPDYKNISIEIPDRPIITDEHLDIQIRNFMRSSPQTEKKDVTGRQVKKGDLISINYEPMPDTVPEAFRENLEQFSGKDITFYYREGRARFVQEFEEAIAELEMGKEITKDIQFPKDYPQQELAGVTVSFKMSLSAHQELIMPTMEDVAAEQGHDSITSWRESLKEQTQKDMDAKYDREIENHKKMQIEAKLLEEANVSPVPDALVDQEAMAFLTQLAKMEGCTVDQYLENKQYTFDDFREEARFIITRKIQLQVILGAIADSEEFSPSEKDISNFIENYAKMNNISSEDARASIDNRYVFANLRIEKGYEIVKNSVESKL